MRYAANGLINYNPAQRWLGQLLPIVSIVQRLSRNAYLNYSTELIVTQGVL
jgi:hypothetical protein